MRLNLSLITVGLYNKAKLDWEGIGLLFPYIVSNSNSKQYTWTSVAKKIWPLPTLWAPDLHISSTVKGKSVGKKEV